MAKPTFYRLHYPDSGVALAGADGIDHLVFGDGDGVRAVDWKPIALVCNGALVDYQPSVLGAPLVSDRMRKIVDENKGADDAIEWLAVSVNGQPYWVASFPNRPPVLDEAKTIAFNGIVAKPVLRASAVGDRHFFSFPGAGLIEVVVSKRMHDAISKCSNVEFGPIAITY